jgi:ATP-dependent RNA helicase DHX29
MADQQTPELLRLSLQDLAIRVKICKLGGIEETLGQALDPPSAKNIRRAIDALIDVRALTQGEDLTPLGIQLARLPLDVFLGKLCLLGSIFKCLDAVITIAAILSSKSPFVAPFGKFIAILHCVSAFGTALSAWLFLRSSDIHSTNSLNRSTSSG